MFKKIKKLCKDCNKIKDLSFFSVRNKEKMGYKTYCKGCMVLRATKYNLKNKEKVKEYHSLYFKRDYVIRKTKNTNCLEENKLKNRERTRAYYKKYPEKNRERARRYVEKNRSKINEKMRIYRKEHPEEYKKNLLKQKENYIKRRKTVEFKIQRNNYNSKRRSFLKKVGKFTKNEWKDKLKHFNNSCAFCKTKERLEVDHIIPISKGGKNTIDNLQPLCKSCNSSKSNKILSQENIKNIITKININQL